MQFRRKPDIVEALTFEAFVEGTRTIAPLDAMLYDGLPRRFLFEGVGVVWLDDDTYLIARPHEEQPLWFKRSEHQLIIRAPGDVYPITVEAFEASYEAVAE